MIVNILGLDGSLQNFGIAVVQVDLDTNKIIGIKDLILSKTKKDDKLKRADDDFFRFRQHSNIIRETIDKYDIFKIYGEIPSGSRDVRAAFAFGGVTAILASLTWEYSVDTVTPIQVKVAATGQKHADKEDVIKAIHNCFPAAPWIKSKKPNAMNIVDGAGFYLTNANEHLADAVGAVLAGLEK